MISYLLVYSIFPDLFLTKDYWNKATDLMLKEKPDMEFVVVTDDYKTAKLRDDRLDTIERALSEIEAALIAVDYWPRDIVRAYQALSAAVADYREGESNN